MNMTFDDLEKFINHKFDKNSGESFFGFKNNILISMEIECCLLRKEDTDLYSIIEKIKSKCKVDEDFLVKLYLITTSYLYSLYKLCPASFFHNIFLYNVREFFLVVSSELNDELKSIEKVLGSGYDEIDAHNRYILYSAYERAMKKFLCYTDYFCVPNLIYEHFFSDKDVLSVLDSDLISETKNCDFLFVECGDLFWKVPNDNAVYFSYAEFFLRYWNISLETPLGVPYSFDDIINSVSGLYEENKEYIKVIIRSVYSIDYIGSIKDFYLLCRLIKSNKFVLKRMYDILLDGRMFDFLSYECKDDEKYFFSFYNLVYSFVENFSDLSDKKEKKHCWRFGYRINKYKDVILDVAQLQLNTARNAIVDSFSPHSLFILYIFSSVNYFSDSDFLNEFKYFDSKGIFSYQSPFPIILMNNIINYRFISYFYKFSAIRREKLYRKFIFYLRNLKNFNFSTRTDIYKYCELVGSFFNMVDKSFKDISLRDFISILGKFSKSKYILGRETDRILLNDVASEKKYTPLEYIERMNILEDYLSKVSKSRVIYSENVVMSILEEEDLEKVKRIVRFANVVSDVC